MLVICCGMVRSASTLRYQIAKALAERAGGEGLGWSWDDVKPRRMSKPGSPIFVVKVHAPSPKVEAKLDPENVRYGYSYRDIRDAIASLEQKKDGLSLDETRVQAERILERDAYFRARPGVLLSRYEAWLDDVEGEIRRYEAFLGVRLDDGERALLARSLSMEGQRSYIEALDESRLTEDKGALFDADSLLHTDHIRDGRVGKWADTLSADQAKIVHEIAGDWLRKNDYAIPASV